MDEAARFRGGEGGEGKGEKRDREGRMSGVVKTNGGGGDGDMFGGLRDDV